MFRMIPFVGAAALVAVCGALALADPVQPVKVKVEIIRAEKAPAEGLKEAPVVGSEDKVYLHAKPDVTGADIASAKVTTDNAGNPAVEVVFTEAGAKKVSALTKQWQGKPLAIVIDGKVISAPVVRAEIGGKAVISGKFTKEEATRIASAFQPKE